jgi:hypothetical protein
MARQRTIFQNFKSIATAANVALGLVILLGGLLGGLFGRLDGPAGHLTNLLGTAAREALRLLPYLVPAAWQALQAYTFDHQWFSACPLQMLVSFLPLLRVMAGAA